jgi:Rod binding domain-containing protein
MAIPIHMSTMSPDHLAVEQLTQNNKLTEAEKIGEVARHFEAILLRQFLNEATKPLMGGDEGMNAAQKGIYQDMITNTLADSISKSGQFGLSQVFRQQLMPRDLADELKQAEQAKTEAADKK